MTTLLGLDLGSARCGVCILTDGRPSAACTIEVDGDIATCATAILRTVNDSECERILIEWGAFYIRPGATPQEASAMARAREIMAVILDRVEQGCTMMGVAAVRMPTATWRSRIGVTRRKRAGIEGFRHASWAWLNPRRNTTDRAVRVALERHFGDLARTLANVHERDACGVALADHLGAPPPKPRARPPRGPRGGGKARSAPEGPSMVDRLCNAIREHAKTNALDKRPTIGLEALACRMAMSTLSLRPYLNKGMACSRIVKVRVGTYALPEDT